MQTNFSTSSQALLDGVAAVLRQQVIAAMSAVESKTSKRRRRLGCSPWKHARVYTGRKKHHKEPGPRNVGK